MKKGLLPKIFPEPLDRGRRNTSQAAFRLSSEDLLEGIVIDDELARSLFPNQEPIGQHITIPFPGFDKPREIIGVVQHL